MKVILEIPNYEFNNDIVDKFQDYFNRVKQDIANGTLCGNYELETTEMFLASFNRMQVLPDNATIGDTVKAMFPNIDFGTLAQDDVIVNKDYSSNDEPQVFIPIKVWNAPYKEI